jgi:hypothetical protein
VTGALAIIRDIIDQDALQIGALYEKARTSLVDSVRYQIECGQRLAEKKAGMPHGEWLPWLEENSDVLGFTSRRTAAMLIKAANGKPASHLDTAQAVQISRATWGHADTIALKWTGDPESFTPTNYIEAAREVMGAIDLDPAFK